MHTGPVEILFGLYRRALLSLMMIRPDQAFHVREIARLTGIPVGSLHRELKLLSSGGILLSERKGNLLYYRANRESPIFPELAGIFRKTIGLADIIRNALTPLAPRIEAAFIFGSMAQGSDRIGSDIDLMIVGMIDFTETVAALADLHNQLGREINPVLLSREEWESRKKQDPFIVRILAEEKIMVLGGTDDLE